MEFEEIKQIWDKQNNELLYALNEKAMHKIIRAKKQKTERITSFSELLLIFVNIISGVFILLMNKQNIYLYLLAGLMLVTAVITGVARLKRRKKGDKFSQTVLGELNQSVATASYQVLLSQIMRWYIIPVGILVALSVWQNHIPIWIIVVSIFIWFASGWEHRIYVRKKRELEVLQKKLTQEKNNIELD